MPWVQKGLFLQEAADVARKELAWEVDYIREAECSEKFKYVILISMYRWCCYRNIFFVFLNINFTSKIELFVF